MKFVNRFVNIVILLLSIATFAMSFLLFQKREQLVKGWEKMSAAVSSASATLDKGSDTDYAKKLSAEAMGHTKYSELETLLPQFQTQVKDITAQRNELGGSLVKVAGYLELPKEFKAETIDSMKTYKQSSAELVAEVENFAQINNNVLSKVVGIGERAGVNTDLAGLKGASASANINKISSGVNSLRSKSDTLADRFSDVAKVVGASANFDGESYRNSVSDALNKVREMKTRHDRFSADLNTHKGIVAKQKTELDTFARSVKVLEQKIANLENKLEIATGGKGKVDDTPQMAPTDPKLLKMLKGRVIDVNTKWDFVVINIGKNSKVSSMNVAIPKNEEMVVVRGLGTASPKFVGKVRIVEVNDDCSIANIVPDKEGDSIKIGDVVYFPNSTIAELEKRVAK